jgi:hypothetical protein
MVFSSTPPYCVLQAWQPVAGAGGTCGQGGPGLGGGPCAQPRAVRCGTRAVQGWGAAPRHRALLCSCSVVPGCPQHGAPPTPPLCAAVLLIQAAATWQREHGGKLPGSYAERTAFKDLLKSWQRHIDGIPLEVGAVGAGAWQVARVAAATSRQLLAHAVPTSGAQCQPAMPEAVAQLARRPFTCCARPLLAPPPPPPHPPCCATPGGELH